jgi:hypothetical protein
MKNITLEILESLEKHRGNIEKTLKTNLNITFSKNLSRRKEVLMHGISTLTD